MDSLSFLSRRVQSVGTLNGKQERYEQEVQRNAEVISVVQQYLTNPQNMAVPNSVHQVVFDNKGNPLGCIILLGSLKTFVTKDRYVPYANASISQATKQTQDEVKLLLGVTDAELPLQLRSRSKIPSSPASESE